MVDIEFLDLLSDKLDNNVELVVEQLGYQLATII